MITRPMPLFGLGLRKPGGGGGKSSPPSKPVQPAKPAPAPAKPTPLPVDARKPEPVRPQSPPLPSRKGPRPKLRISRAKDGSHQIESTAYGDWAPVIVGLDKQYAEDMLKKVRSRSGDGS